MSKIFGWVLIVALIGVVFCPATVEAAPARDHAVVESPWTAWVDAITGWLLGGGDVAPATAAGDCSGKGTTVVCTGQDGERGPGIDPNN